MEKLKVEDLEGYLIKYQLASIYGKGKNLRLEARITIGSEQAVCFVVMDHDEIAASGPSLRFAINVFNELLED